jgi:hypothetical protein
MAGMGCKGYFARQWSVNGEPGRIMVLSAVGMSRRMMVSETPAS